MALKEYTVVIGDLEHTVLGNSQEELEKLYGNAKVKKDETAKSATPANKADNPPNK